MNKTTDKMFVDAMERVLREGTWETGDVRPRWKDGLLARTKFVPQVSFEYDISKGHFPLTSLRQIAWKSGIKEILWIYQDQTNDLRVLKEKYNIHWWDDWRVGDSHNIGQRYGATVRRYDLINKLLDGLKNNPNSRRHIINLYQYADFEETEGLHPCAMETHWTVREDYLDMTLIQRSSDFLVAGHINQIQYVALMMMIAHAVGLKPGKFVHFIQNLHVYNRHFEQLEILMDRYEISNGKAKPQLIFEPKSNDFYSFTIDDFRVEDYNPIKPNLKFELAI